MPKESSLFGAKATNSFNKNFNQYFESSILKLTASYALIFAVILFLAGGITYSVFANRTHRRFNTIIIVDDEGQTQQIKQVAPSLRPPRPTTPTENQLREDLIAAVIYVNTILVLVSAFFGYLLARRTLQPIKLAYEKQQRFLADASHELRTPLAILHLDLENQLQVVKGETKKQALSNLQEVQRMGKLVNDLLVLSRLDQSVTHHMAHVAVLPAVQAVVERFTATAQAQQVTLTLDADTIDTSVTVLAHSDTLVQAISNVIHNAIAYNKKEGIVRVIVQNTAKEVVVTVRDTGVGISKDDLVHIFDRFYRADKSRTRATGGTGLGLAIVQSAVQQSGGTVTIDSIIDQGTTVIMRFPRTA